MCIPAEQCAEGVKKVSMELGGNAPFIVFEDADIDAAVNGAITSKYRNAGQTCVRTNRFFVHASIRDEFCKKYIDAVKRLKSGDGMQPDTDIGPLITLEACNNVFGSLVTESIELGATAKLGGNAPQHGYYPPTVLTDVTHDMPIAPMRSFALYPPSFHSKMKMKRLLWPMTLNTD